MYSLYFFFVLSIFAGLQSFVRKAIVLHFLYAIIIIYLFLLGNQNQDSFAYLDIFDDPDSYAELGYLALVNSTKYLGGTQTWILLFVGALIAFVFLNKALRTPFLALGITCYMIFPLPVDLIQLRNTLAAFFLLGALLCYAEGKPIKATITALAGCSIHYLGFAIFLIILAAIILKDRPKKEKLIWTSLIAIVAWLIFTPVMDFILNTGLSRTLQYYISEEGKIESVAIWGGFIAMTLVIWGYMKPLMDYHRMPLIVRQRILLLHDVILYSILFLPGVYFLFEFNRLYRFVVVVNIFLAIISSPYLSNRAKVMLWAYTVAVSVIFGIYYNSQLDYDYIIFGIRS